MPKYKLSKKTDLIRLSDMFRRHAKFYKPKTVEKLVNQGRRVACLATYYHGENPQLPENKSVDTDILREVEVLADIAAKAGLKEVALTITDDKNSWIGQRVQQVLDSATLPVKVRLQSGTYKDDLSDLGPIDEKIKTALDFGLRGFAKIDDNLRMSWPSKF